MDDINRWYNTSVYQRSNEATKEWCNKQKRIGIHTLACKPARAPTGLPSSLPADRSAGVPACRHTDRQTYQQAIRKWAGSNIMWKRYGIKSRTVRLIFINKQAVVQLSHSPVPAELSVSATHIQLKGKTYWLVSLKNIHTALEHSEMEAWQKLIRVLTHEIMNSITPIISLADTLSERSKSTTSTQADSTMQQGLQIIRRRSKGLLEFVENYRKLTRIAPPAKSDIRIKDFFEDLKQLFADPHITFDCPDTPQTWKADRGQMEQVFINLIKNAQEACRDNPSASVSVRAYTSDRKWKFIITDNGEGMLPEVTERIFLPFFTTKPGGSGIGLALCKQITVLHGGQIAVTSEPDKGSTFTLTFPV